MKAWPIALAALLALDVGDARVAEPDATNPDLAKPDAQRGKRALFTRAFVPAPWPLAAYDNVWKVWEPAAKEKPADYDQAFRRRYGLHPPPYPNGKLPMGLREGRLLFAKGVATDCLLCHAGSIFGTSYPGLGNAALDIHALFEELGKATTGSGRLPFKFSNVRGTSEAGAFAVYLWSFREPDLSIRLQDRYDFELRDDLCEDVPAWWLLKKKKTMYFTGTTDARSVRSIMQFMLTPDNTRAVFEKEESTYADIQAYILSLEAPKYPLPIDRELARQGEGLFNRTCAKCHGTYGAKWTYPNKIVPMETIGTDATRFHGLSRKLGEHYNRSWFGAKYPSMEAKGYQAPPLDGVWATAPYFHHGAVPTLHDVLDSNSRPRIFTRSYGTGRDDYDAVKVGWKVEALSQGADPKQPGIERRKVYDTTQPGRGNGGHTFGDHFSDAERRAVVEYLKTL
ncbi:MAG: c-type cytochrome [Gemmataceae bacterium]|nr:c-type cytochrome [Gemmataceae bacterium]